jgi:hypothetical protein
VIGTQYDHSWTHFSSARRLAAGRSVPMARCRRMRGS